MNIVHLLCLLNGSILINIRYQRAIATIVYYRKEFVTQWWTNFIENYMISQSTNIIKCYYNCKISIEDMLRQLVQGRKL